MRHEANAGIAAAVYGKLTRTPGVVLATLGPGAANLLLPMANAYLDQEPLLAITAQLPDEFPDTHTHQLLPLHETFQPICRVVDKITQGNVSEVVDRAIAACMSRPYTTSYLTMSAREALKPVTMIGRRYSEGPPTRPMANPAQKAADLRARCAMASKPIVLIGLGLDVINADRLRKWIDTWKLPFAVTPKVKGIVDETSPYFVGVISGMAADGVMVDALNAADLRIGFGLDPVEIDKTWHAELDMHWVLESRNATGVLPEHAPLVNHMALLDALLDGQPPKDWGMPFAEFQKKRRDLLNDRAGAAFDSAQARPNAMWPGDIIRVLSEAMPHETIVTTDVGSHKYLFGQYWPSRHPATFWMSNGLSGMAYGLSAAIGAKLARPDAPVLAAVGDGGFSMNAQELETADRVGAPFITVVLEDHSYSLIKLSQENKKLEPYRMDFNPIDTVKMAEACGVKAIRSSNADQIGSAVRQAVAGNTSLVVGIPVHYADYRKIF
jgi:acetolactate synthase-1/2/3 large subunit